jgi:uncharacterized membrane protein YjdF
MLKLAKLINRLLFLGIVISGAIYVLLTKTYNFIPSVYILTILASLISLVLIKNKKISETWGIYIHLGLWANLIGEYYFYYHWVHYDKFLHFIIPLIMTIAAYEYFEKNSRGPPKKFLIFLAVLGVSAFFEIFEYFQSRLFNFPSVGVYIGNDLVMSAHDDTIWDLTCSCLGSLVYLSYIEIKTRKEIKAAKRAK